MGYAIRLGEQYFCSNQSVAHETVGSFGHTRPQGTMLLPVINFKIYMDTVCTVRMASNVVTRKTGLSYDTKKIRQWGYRVA